MSLSQLTTLQLLAFDNLQPVTLEVSSLHLDLRCWVWPLTPASAGRQRVRNVDRSGGLFIYNLGTSLLKHTNTYFLQSVYVSFEVHVTACRRLHHWSRTTCSYVLVHWNCTEWRHSLIFSSFGKRWPQIKHSGGDFSSQTMFWYLTFNTSRHQKNSSSSPPTDQRSETRRTYFTPNSSEWQPPPPLHAKRTFPKALDVWRRRRRMLQGNKCQIDFITCCSDLIEWFVAQLSTRHAQWEWWVPRVQLSPARRRLFRLPSSIFIRVTGRVLAAPRPRLPCTHPARMCPGSGSRFLVLIWLIWYRPTLPVTSSRVLIPGDRTSPAPHKTRIMGPCPASTPSHLILKLFRSSVSVRTKTFSSEIRKN